jgi:Ca-activated chloride channel family protein
VSFHHPVVFVLGILTPFLVVALHLFDRRRQRLLMERLGELPAVQRMMAARSPRRRAIKAVLSGLGLGLVVMAGSGPWVHDSHVTRRKGMDVVLALDVSKSMLVGDVQVGEPRNHWPADMKDEDPRPVPKDPVWVQGTRLERARQVIDALADKLPDDRIGVVLFAGASVHFPLTDDEHLAIELAHLMGPSDLMGGSDVAEALRVGKCILRADVTDPMVRCAGINRHGNGGAPLDGKPVKREIEKSERGKAIVIFTDGGERTDAVMQEVDQAHQLGISVFFVGVGSAKGGPVPELDWQGHIDGAKKDANGKAIQSKLDSDELRALAAAAGDATHYVEVPPDGAFDVTPILQQLSNVQRGDLETTDDEHKSDVYFWFLFPGMVLLVVEAAIGLRKRVKHPEAVP